MIIIKHFKKIASKLKEKAKAIVLIFLPKFRQKKWVALRFFLVIIISVFFTNYIADVLSIRYKFQPLIKNNNPISIEVKPLGGLQSYLNLSPDLLTYKTAVFNNIVTTINSDGIDYKHEVDISIKYQEQDSAKIKLPFGQTSYIFDGASLTRNETILAILKLVYLPNINLKPELFSVSTASADQRHMIIVNKAIVGELIVESCLDYQSRFILFLSILVLFGIISQSFYNIYQFIFWKY
jgi:hypothetical protein